VIGGIRLSIDLGGEAVSLDLRHWVNSGLMTFFFVVLGLEARLEFDLGELRERRRFALPLLAAAWRWRSRSATQGVAQGRLEVLHPRGTARDRADRLAGQRSSPIHGFGGGDQDAAIPARGWSRAAARYASIRSCSRVSG
jgi:hypothetical protein